MPLTTRDRRIIAEVLDRLVCRDIDSRDIRATVKPDQHSLLARDLLEFASAMRLDADGDDVDMASAAADAVEDAHDMQHQHPYSYRL